MKKLVSHTDGNKTFKKYIYTYFVVGFGPQGAPSFMEGGRPNSCLVYHTRAPPNPEPGSGLECIYIQFFKPETSQRCRFAIAPD